MISKIFIQNFKSLKNIDLECSNLNFFTGLNGMGKSSIIQALLLLRQSYNKGHLNKEGLTLKGDLVNIGAGKDALYEFAEKEEITFSVVFNNGTNVIDNRWIFEYEKNQDNLEYKYSGSDVMPFAEDTTIPSNLEELPLFNFHLKYLNAERWVRNQYEVSDYEVVKNKNIGKNGEFTAHYLDHFGSKKEAEVTEELLYPGTSVKELSYQVSAWMNDISPGTSVIVERIKGLDVVRLSYTFQFENGQTNEIMPTNVGFGMTYVLPVLVLLLSAKPGDVLIIENPESHVHPKGQSSLGRLMALVAQQGVQLFVESHSDHTLNGIRVAVKQGVAPELVKVFFLNRVSHENEIYSEFVTPKIDKDGRIDFWPEHFFDEWDNNLIELL